MLFLQQRSARTYVTKNNRINVRTHTQNRCLLQIVFVNTERNTTTRRDYGYSRASERAASRTPTSGYLARTERRDRRSVDKPVYARAPVTYY